MPLRSSLAGFRRRGVLPVQPLHVLMIGDVPVEQQLITEQLGDAVHVPDIAPGPGGPLHPDRAGRAPDAGSAPPPAAASSAASTSASSMAWQAPCARYCSIG